MILCNFHTGISTAHGYEARSSSDFGVELDVHRALESLSLFAFYDGSNL